MVPSVPLVLLVDISPPALPALVPLVPRVVLPVPVVVLAKPVKLIISPVGGRVPLVLRL